MPQIALGMLGTLVSPSPSALQLTFTFCVINLGWTQLGNSRK